MTEVEKGDIVKISDDSPEGGKIGTVIEIRHPHLSFLPSYVVECNDGAIVDVYSEDVEILQRKCRYHGKKLYSRLRDKFLCPICERRKLKMEQTDLADYFEEF